MHSIDHHYCPIFYLKGFTNSSGKLWRFDKTHKYSPYKEVYPKQIMFEEDMNTFDLPFGRSSEVEDVLFKRLDDDWAPLVKQLQETEDIPKLEQKDFTLLTQFISWQYIRSPFMVNEIDKIKGKKHKIENFLERFKIQMSIHASFYKKAITFHSLKDDSEFLTSDNPCFLYSNYPIQFMPLTKKLLMTWEDADKLIFYKHETDKQMAEGINNLIVSDSRKYSVGSRKDLLFLAFENTKGHPGFLEKI